MKIGYARVSTGLQNLDLQLDALKKEWCEHIFEDKLSGSNAKRQGLDEALKFLRPRDILVVWRLDRLGRNMKDLISMVNDLNDKNITFYSIQENITMDRKTATGQLMFHLFAAFAEFERNLILERSAAGRALARARGRLGGRPNKLTEEDVKMIELLLNENMEIKQIAKRFNVSRTTIYKYLNKVNK